MNFSKKSSEYVVLISMSILGSADLILQDYWFLRHDLYINTIQHGSRNKYSNKRFHASEDPQTVRDKVFSLISHYIENFEVRSLIIEKKNVYDFLKSDEWLFKKMYYYLVRSILTDKQITKDINGIQFIIDYNQIKRLVKATQNGLHLALSVANNQLPFGIHHSPSGSHPFLQLADYFCWAIYRKYESHKKDLRSYNLITKAIVNEWKMI